MTTHAVRGCALLCLALLTSCSASRPPVVEIDQPIQVMAACQIDLDLLTPQTIPARPLEGDPASAWVSAYGQAERALVAANDGNAALAKAIRKCATALME